MESVPIESVVLPGSSTQCFDSPVSKVLENEYILVETSSYLSTPDLKTFRLVNWIWNKTCVPIARKKFPKVLILQNWKLMGKDRELNSNEDNFFKHLKNGMGNVEKALERLTSLIQNSVNGFPCAKFHIGTEILSTFSQDDEVITSFIKAISSFATEITLWKGKGTIFFENPEAGFEFPNLKSLSVLVGRNTICTGNKDLFLNDLEGQTLPRKGQFRQDINFVKSILQNAPNLQNFRFATRGNSPMISEFLKIFGRVENINKVKNLELCGVFQDTHFAKLAEMQLNLEKLTLFFVNGTSFQAYNFKNFLQTQSASLKELCIDCDLSESSLSLKFPQMKKLINLKIQNLYNDEDTGLAFPEMSLVSSFPVLKNFAHACGPFNLANFFNSEMKPLVSVDTLELPLDLYDEDDQDKPMNDDVNITDIIREAGRIFPNLKSLKVLGKYDVMQAVAAHMGLVEKLTLGGPGKPHTDMYQVLSGYTLEEIAELGGNVGNKRLRGPLSLLHSLKVLKLEHAKISDWICQLGPLKMQGLECLDLSSLKCKLLEHDRNNGVNKVVSDDDDFEDDRKKDDVGDDGNNDDKEDDGNNDDKEDDDNKNDDDDNKNDDDDDDNKKNDDDDSNKEDDHDEDKSNNLELKISGQLLAEMRQKFLVLTNEYFAPD